MQEHLITFVKNVMLIIEDPQIKKHVVKEINIMIVQHQHVKNI